MDLNTIGAVVAPAARADLPAHRAGDAFLAGGTWLFSEPQIELSRLVDLSALDWPHLRAGPQGLRIGATCPIAALAAWEMPPDWRAGPLFLQCCRALLGSFKIWNMATVGGNLCMALPAGPMIALCVALDGRCLIWTPDGGERMVAAADFVLNPQCNCLADGEVLRRIDLPLRALQRRTAFRRISLSPAGRSGALLIGTRGDETAFALTVTAATRLPVHVAFTKWPTAAELVGRLRAEIPDPVYYDDVHGRPDWRRHMTFVFAEEIRRELAPA